MSVSTFTQSFKRDMNISVYQYILRKKLILARQRIHEGESATAAAMSCGFNDYSSFYKQYKKMFEMDGVELTFQEDALEYIVDKAIEYQLGARGLRSIVESIMIDAMFELPSSDEKSFAVTKEYAAEQLVKANFELSKEFN